MANRSFVGFFAPTAVLATALGLTIGQPCAAAPFASSMSPARIAAARRYATSGGASTAARTGASSALRTGPPTASRPGSTAISSGAPNQKPFNYVGKSQISVATRPSMQIPVATRPPMQVTSQRTPGLSTSTPPMIKARNYEPTNLVGFFPVMKPIQAAAKQQAKTGDDRHPIHKRVNLHPERGWQASTTGAAAAFRRAYQPKLNQ